MNPTMLDEIIKTIELKGFTINNMVITCDKCKESSEALKSKDSFVGHLYFLTGFTRHHKKCNQ